MKCSDNMQHRTKSSQQLKVNTPAISDASGAQRRFCSLLCHKATMFVLLA